MKINFSKKLQITLLISASLIVVIVLAVEFWPTADNSPIIEEKKVVAPKEEVDPQVAAQNSAEKAKAALKFQNFLDYVEIAKKMKDSYCMPLILVRNELVLKFSRKDESAKAAYAEYVKLMETYPTGVNTYMNDKKRYLLWQKYEDIKSAIWLDKTARKELIHLDGKDDKYKKSRMGMYYFKYYTSNLLENHIKRLDKSPLAEYMNNADMSETKKLKMHWLRIAGEYKLEPEEDKRKFVKKRLARKNMIGLIVSEGYLDQITSFYTFLDFVHLFIAKFPQHRKELEILGTCFGAGMTFGKGRQTIFFEASKKSLKRVRVHLFEKEDFYLSFLANEQSERFTDGEEVIIPWEDLRKKLSRYERFVKKHREYRTLELLGTIATLVSAYTCGLEGDRDRCRTDNEIGLSYKKFLEENRDSQFITRIEALHDEYYPDL